MPDSVLESVTLSEQMGNRDPIDRFPAVVHPGLDIGTLSVREVEGDLVECEIEFEFYLSNRRDDIVCTVSASFRLCYRMVPLDGLRERKRWASTVVLRDAWPYWRTYLANTLTLMGLPPSRLPPQPAPPLFRTAREAFDLTRELAHANEDDRDPDD